MASLIGKKVATIANDGSWRDFVVVPVSTLLTLDDHVDLDEASCAFVTPITVFGLIDSVEKLGAKVIINAGASSQVGK